MKKSNVDENWLIISEIKVNGGDFRETAYFDIVEGETTHKFFIFDRGGAQIVEEAFDTAQDALNYLNYNIMFAVATR